MRRRQIRSPLHTLETAAFLERMSYYKQGSLEERAKKFCVGIKDAIDNDNLDKLKFILSLIAGQDDPIRAIFNYVDDAGFTLLGYAVEKWTFLQADRNEQESFSDILSEIIVYSHGNTYLGFRDHGSSRERLYLSPISLQHFITHAYKKKTDDEIKNCKGSFYHSLIIESAKRKKEFDVKKDVEKVFLFKDFNFMQLANWFFNAVRLEEHMSVIKNGKKANEMLVDYFRSLPPTHDRYIKFVAELDLLRPELERHNLLSHPLIATFFQLVPVKVEHPAIPAEFLSEPSPIVSSTPKSKKKHKAKSKVVTATPMLEEEKVVVDFAPQQIIAMRPRVEISSPLILLLVEEIKSAATLTIACERLYEIINLLAIADLTGLYRQFQQKLAETVTNFEPMIFNSEDYISTLPASDFRNCWAEALKEIFLRRAELLAEESIATDENALLKFIETAAQCVDLAIEEIELLQELKMKLISFFHQHYPNMDLWLVGSLATLFLERAFSRGQVKLEIKSDIDLVLILGEETGNPYKLKDLLNPLKGVLGASNFFIKKSRSQTQQPHMLTVEFTLQGVAVDLVIYANVDARPKPVETYKGFEFSLTQKTLRSPADFLFEFLSGERSFDLVALKDPCKLAYALRELARNKIELSDRFKADFALLLEDKINHPLIATAVALMLTKYTKSTGSQEFQFFLQQRYYRFIPILDACCSEKKKAVFVMAFIDKALTVLPATAKHNHLPSMLLAASYLAHWRDDFANHIAELRDLPFPASVKEGAELFLQAFAAIRSNKREFCGLEKHEHYFTAAKELRLLIVREYPDIFKQKFSAWLPQTIFNKQPSGPAQSATMTTTVKLN